MPQLGSQIYTMAGMATRLHLQADRPGTFRGLSAHFSGDGFSDMNFAVIAVTPGAFARWAGARKARGGVLDLPTYAALARPSHKVAAFDYGNVTPQLFDTVLHTTIRSAGKPVSATASVQ